MVGLFLGTLSLRAVIFIWNSHKNVTEILSSAGKLCSTYFCHRSRKDKVLYCYPVENFKVSLKSDKNNGHFWWRHVHLSQHLTELFLEWDLLQIKVVEQIKSTFYIEQLLSRRSCCLWDNVENYCRAGQAVDENMALALSIQIHTQIM
jgi:hypothetical protein